MQPIAAEALRRRSPESAAPGRRSANAPARTLLDILRATTSAVGDRLALDADVALTYVELSDRAHALAQRLAESGVGPGDRVGVRVSSGTADLYVAILGVLEAGAAYVPLDADDPPARATELLERARACAVVEDGLAIRPLGPGGGAGNLAVGPGDDAWVVFTSGSTGAPKAVAVSHRAAAAFVDAEAELFEIGPEDRVLAGLSVAFDASCEEMWLAWRHGATLVPAPRALVRAGAELGPWLMERKITVVSTVPTLAAMWDEGDLKGVRLLILGGEACPERLGWRLAEHREVWNTYGPTEATVVSTAAPIRAGEPITIGWPLAGWEVAVLDEAGDVAPVGEAGELVIGGVGLGRYLDPGLDQERFGPVPSLGWERAYRTGDIVRSSVGGIEFLGRRDDQVKVGGRRIELGEIDARLTAVPGVRAAAAAVRESAAGNKLLVGYVVADVEPAQVRAAVALSLPQGMVPLIVSLDALPRGISGKVDRKALPWPPPAPVARSAEFAAGSTAAWLAEQWAEQLGPLPIGIESDFFDLGGTSLGAAKLVSALRTRFPSIAVADVYTYRRLGELAARLDSIGSGVEHVAGAEVRGWRRWSALQLAGLATLIALGAPQWLLAIFAVNQLEGGHLGPEIGWGWLIAGWLVFGTATGGAVIVLVARRLSLGRVAPGRYPRRGWLACRIWFLERLAESYRSESLAGTPFAQRFARLCGHHVGRGARLGSLPPVTSLVSIGEDATIEADVDLHGWWIEGNELVVGEIEIGAGARVGARALLEPGAVIGAGAEIEPGTVVKGRVPAGERWAGSPGRRIGEAGHSWPTMPAPRPRRARVWKAMYLVGLTLQAMLPLLAAAPGAAFLLLTGSDQNAGDFASRLVFGAPVVAIGFLVTYALLIALVVRGIGRLIRPGYHADWGRIGWAMWFSEALMHAGRGTLFSLYSSLFTRPWLRLAGIPVSKRAEVSTVVGANRLTSFGERSFTADDVALISARARGGWLHVAPVEIGAGTFLGNGAILDAETLVGDGCLIGVLTAAPHQAADGTSWLGSPALELRRVPDRLDPARTISPPRRLVLARAVMEMIRIVLPATISVALAGLAYLALELIGQAGSVLLMVLATPAVLLAAGICAVAITIAAKWALMGRYRAGEHPLWSFFVWRDEILNSLQDQLAGTWLLGLAQATPLMSVYLRAMGTKVGRDVWCDTLTITEFDMVELGDGCVINRFACVETHLFHDRLMRIGPARLGAGSTLGPSSALLPDTVLGDSAVVGGRSVVMRGEELPPGTRWQGAPVASSAA
jgi:non-ribosomal peptide synthetase-like protein